MSQPAPPPEMPSEIVVTDHGDDDITFALPPRQIGPLRLIGLPLIAFGCAFLYWVVWIGMGNLRGNKPRGIEDYIMLSLGFAMGLAAYFPIWIGLMFLAGRRVIELRGGKLRAIERVGPFWRTKRWPLAKLVRVEIVGLNAAAKEAPKEGTLLSQLDALSGLLDKGPRFMIAQGYPRRLLKPIAAEIARRCNAKFENTDREQVVVTTLVLGGDPADQWNTDDAKRPANSRATLDEYPEGVTITLPPVGFRGAAATLFLIGAIMTCVMGLLSVIARDAPAFVYPLFGLIGIVGLLLAIHGIRIARRQVVIAFVAPRLLILQTGLIKSLERSWEVSDLAAIRVGKSGMEVNDEPVLELQIVPKTGVKFGLLASRDTAEIAWIAAELRRRTGLMHRPSDGAAQ